jgi:membrane fusion protein, multidrug efflux system
VTLESLRNALLVPQKAVAELQATYSVAVVTADNKVESRPVSVGPRVGVLWVIEKGLKPDDRVVVEGAQKIRPGMVVKPTLVEIKEPPSRRPREIRRGRTRPETRPWRGSSSIDRSSRWSSRS